MTGKVLLKGVRGPSKCSSKTKYLINENPTYIKLFPYKKPTCSMDVLMRLILSDGKERSAMEIWKNVRHYFPYFARSNSNFTLKSVLIPLRDCSDVIHKKDETADVTRRDKFYLKKDISFRYSIEEVIGSTRDSLEHFTRHPEQVEKMLKYFATSTSLHTGEKSPKAHGLINTSKSSSTHLKSISKLPTFCNRLTTNEYDSVHVSNTFKSSKDVLDSNFINEKLPHNGSEHLIISIPLEKLSIVPPMKSGDKNNNEINKTETFKRKRKKDKKKRSHKKYKNDHKYTSWEKKSERKDDHNFKLSKKSKNKADLPKVNSSKDDHENDQCNTEDFTEIDSECSNPLNINQNSFLHTDTDTFSLIEDVNEGSDGNMILNFFTEYQADFQESESIDDEVIFLKEVGPLPDSTMKTNSPIRIKEEIEYSIGRKDVDFIKRRLSEEAVSSTSHFESVCQFNSSIEISGVSNLLCNLPTEDINFLIAKYNWAKYSQDKIACIVCDCNLNISFSIKISEFSEKMSEHDTSIFHEIHKWPKFASFIVILNFMLRTNLNSLTSRNHIMDEAHSISKTLGTLQVDEKSILRLMRIFKKYAEDKIFSYLRSSNQPYSLVISFCDSLVIIRTLNEENNVTEVVLVIQMFKFKTLNEFMESFSMPKSKLLHTSVFPTCKNCDKCRDISEWESSVYSSLPHSFPSLSNHLKLISKESVVQPYYEFTRQLIHLYKKYSFKFKQIPRDYKLRNADIWSLYQYIFENLDVLQKVCLEIFRSHGEILAFAISSLSLKFDDELLMTLRLINLVNQFVKSNYIVSLNNGGYNVTKEGFWKRSESLGLEIHQSGGDAKIKKLLIDFVKNLRKEYYHCNWDIAQELQSFYCSSFLSSLDKASLGDSTSIMQTISALERCMAPSCNSLCKELTQFGIYLTKYFPNKYFSTLSNISSLFSKDRNLSDKFPSAQKFYSYIKLLPLYKGSNNSCSLLHIKSKYKNFVSKFGEELSESLLVIYFNGFSQENFTPLLRYIEQNRL